jgi:hypothetical protein
LDKSSTLFYEQREYYFSLLKGFILWNSQVLRYVQNQKYKDLILRCNGISLIRENKRKTKTLVFSSTTRKGKLVDLPSDKPSDRIKNTK